AREALAQAAPLLEAGGPAERGRYHLARARLELPDRAAALRALDDATAAIAASAELAGPVPRLRGEIDALRRATAGAAGITQVCRDSSCSLPP
ncbi:MAG: hypothetical protein K8W52_26585, partial [Deltaproteobacteria bacterium]|nr:hypothetical protein [Deltaproteobacteria bacterium]